MGLPPLRPRKGAFATEEVRRITEKYGRESCAMKHEIGFSSIPQTHPARSEVHPIWAYATPKST